MKALQARGTPFFYDWEDVGSPDFGLKPTNWLFSSGGSLIGNHGVHVQLPLFVANVYYSYRAISWRQVHVRFVVISPGAVNQA